MSFIRFLQGSSGRVFCKTLSDAEEISVKIFEPDAQQFDHNWRPRKITSGGLSYERQEYLNSRIRAFVSNPWKYITRPPVQSDE